MPELGRSEVALEILAYLADNPTAQDTLVGIIKWWLLEQQIRTQTFVVQEALAELIARDLIEGRRGRDSHVHYRINASKLREVLDLLAARNPQPHLSG